MRTSRLNALWWRVGSTTFTIDTCWTFCWEKRLQSTRVYCKEITSSTIECWRSLKGLVNWKLMLNELFRFEIYLYLTLTHAHIDTKLSKQQQKSRKSEKWEIYVHPALASAVTAVKSSHQTFRIDDSKWQRRPNAEFKNRRERWQIDDIFLWVRMSTNKISEHLQGVKDPERVKRNQQRAAEVDRMQDQNPNGMQLRWAQD